MCRSSRWRCPASPCSASAPRDGASPVPRSGPTRALPQPGPQQRQLSTIEQPTTRTTTAAARATASTPARSSNGRSHHSHRRRRRYDGNYRSRGSARPPRWRPANRPCKRAAPLVCRLHRTRRRRRRQRRRSGDRHGGGVGRWWGRSRPRQRAAARGPRAPASFAPATRRIRGGGDSGRCSTGTARRAVGAPIGQRCRGERVPSRPTRALHSAASARNRCCVAADAGLSVHPSVGRPHQRREKRITDSRSEPQRRASTVSAMSRAPVRRRSCARSLGSFCSRTTT